MQNLNEIFVDRKVGSSPLHVTQPGCYQERYHNKPASSPRERARSLDEAGIHLVTKTEGRHRMPCPECQKGPRDDALVVTVTARRWAFWACMRCDWRGGAPLDPPAAQRGVVPRSQPVPSAVHGDDADQHQTLSPWGRALWKDCQLVAVGTPAAAYFLGRRCALPEHGVRWHPALKHPSGHIGPCVVALVRDVTTGAPLNLHRTWIKQDGSGKAEVEPARLLLKGHRKAGGVARLFPLDGTGTLAIAEGIESALAVAGHAQRPVWSCLDAANLAACPIIPGVSRLTIYADHDRPNPRTGIGVGQAAAAHCAARWRAAGVEVEVWMSAVESRDFNDEVMS